MRFYLAILSFILALAAPAETYVGAAGSLWLPQGGSRLARVGGAAVRAGHYFDEDSLWAAEAEAGWLEDASALAVRGVWHWQDSRLYGDFFGYSPFDPFFTLGVAGIIARRGNGQLGPELGVGALYHLTDNWALRADARALLGLDTEVEMQYSFGVGVQYGF